jgi:hypothetical protein
MGKLGKNLGQIASIYRANAVDLMVFGAVQHQRMQNPDCEVKQTLKLVAQSFGFDESDINALEVGYYRTLKAYVANSGV